MGFFAGSLGGNDTTPGASFDRPPATITIATITGTVTDADSHLRWPGSPVTLAFQGAGTVNPTDVTDADGDYRSDVPAGTYPKLQVRGHGYSARRTVTVDAGPATVDFDVHKNLATRAARCLDRLAHGRRLPGLQPAAGDRPEPGHRLEHQHPPGQQQRRSQRHLPPKSFVVDLGGTYVVKSFGVDPSASCGDGASAGTGLHDPDLGGRLGRDAGLDAASGTFTSADDGRINVVDAIPNRRRCGS